MTRLAAPLIIAAHVATLPTLTGWSAVVVTDGPRVSRDHLDRYATIGYIPGDDGPSLHLEPRPGAQQQTTEAGSIACALVVRGDDVPSARATLLDLLVPWADWLRADATLGGVLLAGSVLTLAADVTPSVPRGGGAASAVVSISYTATTYG